MGRGQQRTFETKVCSLQTLEKQTGKAQTLMFIWFSITGRLSKTFMKYAGRRF